MKKLTLFILLFAFSLGCLAACNESVSDSSIADESSEIVISDVESSVIETDESSESTEESSEAPTIDMSKVLYNPSDDPGGCWTSIMDVPYPYRHMGLDEYSDAESIPDDSYLCVSLDYEPQFNEQYTTDMNMRSFMEERGYIEDKSLTDLFYHIRFGDDTSWIETVSNRGAYTVGYIPIALMYELMEMEYPVLYVWLREDCIDGCEVCIPPYVKNDISE